MSEKYTFTVKQIKKKFRYDKIQSDEDILFELKQSSARKIKEIFNWANNKGFNTSVSMLDVRISVARTKADKTFEEVMALIHKNVIFRIVLRKNANLFLMVSNKKVYGDYLEIAVRNIDVGNKEYFIFVYLEPKHLDYLLNNYNLRRIGMLFKQYSK